MARFVKFDTADRAVTFPAKGILSIETSRPISIPAGYWVDSEDGAEEEWVAQEGEMLVVNVTVNVVGIEPIKFKAMPEFIAAFEGWVTKQHLDTEFGNLLRKDKVLTIHSGYII